MGKIHERFIGIINDIEINQLTIGTSIHFFEQYFEKTKSYPENLKLQALVKEYKIEDLYPDLYLISDFMTLKAIQFHIWDLSGTKYKDFIAEFMGAKKFLFEEKGKFDIQLKSKEEKKSILICNPLIVEAIFEAMDNALSEIFHAEISKEFPDYLKYDLWNLLKELYSAEQGIYKKKGRRKRPISTGYFIDLLQKYLQKYTYLKAEDGTQISREQGRFIYTFLQNKELIFTSDVWPEDNIRLTLADFRQSVNGEEI